MRETLEIPADQTSPELKDVLEMQGIPAQGEPSPEVDALLRKAMETFLQFARPRAVVSSISIPEFADVYRGEGLNPEATPLEDIFRRSEFLALFAVTIGQKITDGIDELFQLNEFALGSMLDSVASAGTDRAADLVERRFSDLISGEEKISLNIAMMRFSPGYCGWHMSGQRKLFGYLHPKEIGIELLDSYLMKPLKSISGVLVAGDQDIFRFEDSYPFCSECSSRDCRDRMRAGFGSQNQPRRKV
jgi:hypothetical protein